jgi:hypothetical protein
MEVTSRDKSRQPISILFFFLNREAHSSRPIGPLLAQLLGHDPLT